LCEKTNFRDIPEDCAGPSGHGAITFCDAQSQALVYLAELMDAPRQTPPCTNDRAQSAKTTRVANAAGDSSSSDNPHSKFTRCTWWSVMRAMYKWSRSGPKRDTAAQGCKVPPKPDLTASISMAKESISSVTCGVTLARAKAALSVLRKPCGPVGKIKGS
jgi:hypothetical protein